MKLPRKEVNVAKTNKASELQIVVELGNLVPRNNLALQKVFEDLEN